MDKRLLRIKEKLLKNNCDGYIVTNDSDIRYFSGLKSSNILLLITNNKSYVLSDGRYKYMIERQEIFEPVCVTKSIIESVCDLAKELNLKKVMIDPEYINHKNYKKLSEKINLVDCANITKELRIIKTKEEIENIKKDVLKIASKVLRNTRKLHFELEKIYSEFIDFNGLDNAYVKIKSDIEKRINKIKNFN